MAGAFKSLSIAVVMPPRPVVGASSPQLSICKGSLRMSSAQATSLSPVKRGPDVSALEQILYPARRASFWEPLALNKMSPETKGGGVGCEMRGSVSTLAHK